MSAYVVQTNYISFDKIRQNNFIYRCYTKELVRTCKNMLIKIGGMRYATFVVRQNAEKIVFCNNVS
jgi:hypothetical protein